MVSPIAIRRLLSRPRHRLAVALVLLALGAIVGAHHAAPMPDMAGVGSAAVICLAVLALGAVIVLGTRSSPLPRWGRRLIASRPPLSALTPRPAPARAGPLYLKLAVMRR